jgi:hypothetical protein
VIGLAISLMIQVTVLMIRLAIILAQLLFAGAVLIVAWISRTIESNR